MIFWEQLFAICLYIGLISKTWNKLFANQWGKCKPSPKQENTGSSLFPVNCSLSPDIGKHSQVPQPIVVIMWGSGAPHLWGWWVAQPPGSQGLAEQQTFDLAIPVPDKSPKKTYVSILSTTASTALLWQTEKKSPQRHFPPPRNLWTLLYMERVSRTLDKREFGDRPIERWPCNDRGRDWGDSTTSPGALGDTEAGEVEGTLAWSLWRERWTSGLQNATMNSHCLKLPRLWYFVTSAGKADTVPNVYQYGEGRIVFS